MASTRDLALLRLVAQRIAGQPFESAVDAVGWLTALQAQDYRGAITSIALRTNERTRTAVEAALNSGAVVRSWPMRGTLHFVLAEDLRWMLALTAERLITGAAARRANLELDMATIERAGDLASAALEGGKRLRREELLAIWNEAGLLTIGQRGYHLIWHLAQAGILCFGATNGNEQEIVLLDEWAPNPRRLEREEALGEWALRYFRSHGPATAKDFAWWTKLTMKDVKTGLALARAQLDSMVVDGVEYFMDPRTRELLDCYRQSAEGLFLLPGFDEFILGYQDRSAALPAEFAGRIVPGNNGMFLPTVVLCGQVEGTWKRVRRGAKQTLLTAPFTAFEPEIEATLPALFAALP
jgi:hypothetical protein